MKVILRDHLFSEYNTIMKPSELPGFQIKVQLDLLLDQILELSQTDSMISVRLKLKQSWVDVRLLWNPSAYKTGIRYNYQYLREWSS